MTNIYKVILYYYCGDARPEPGGTIFVSCNHEPSYEELANNELVLEELANNHCDYIGEIKLVPEDRIGICSNLNIISIN